MNLQDPNSLVNSKTLFVLQSKLSSTYASLVKHPKDGGCPFLFTLIANKSHILSTLNNKTASTDGHTFFWNPDFLEKLSQDELKTTLMHEMYHVVLLHTKYKQCTNDYVFGLSCDYEVNSIIMMEHKRFNLPTPFKIGSNLGAPISLKDFLDYIDAKKDLPKYLVLFADIELYGKTNKDIYTKIYEHWCDSPRLCASCNALSINPLTKKSNLKPPYVEHACQKCGIVKELPPTLDTHIQSKSKDIQSEIRSAASLTKEISKDHPSLIMERLGLLKTPKYDFIDLINNACLNISRHEGNKNNWKRPRRRLLSNNIYMPSRSDYLPTWLCMVDTSASMSKEDITFGLSQLQTLVPKTQGYVVGCDNKTYWEQIIKIEDFVDLVKFKIFGRGNTDFKSFFSEFPKRIKDISVIIIITDGLCPIVSVEYKPKQPVIWILTSHLNFNPRFGETTFLK